MRRKTIAFLILLVGIGLVVAGCKVLNKEKQAAESATDSSMLLSINRLA